MTAKRLRAITSAYSPLRVAVLGDVCLDRYLEIDPKRKETSLETGLPVHNVTSVRSQPGGAGTILNNLVALGIARIWPIGFCGEDGEGFELQGALKKLPGVALEHFFATKERRTFTYTKPLVIAKGKAPRELNRFDFKNWSATPKAVSARIAASVRALAPKINALIILDQTNLPQTGVVTKEVLAAIASIAAKKPRLVILADSRSGIARFPDVSFKLNARELAAHIGVKRSPSLAWIKSNVAFFAQRHARPMFVTLAEKGIVGADAAGVVAHLPPHPIRGEIDIVGAGDAVTANLAAALAARATVPEALAIANAAASVVIHKLGTTGTASMTEIAKTLTQRRRGSRRKGTT